MTPEMVPVADVLPWHVHKDQPAILRAGRGIISVEPLINAVLDGARAMES